MTIKTITTVDGINVVDFGNTINEYYWFKNLGDTTIYVSNKEDFKAGDDGVSELTVKGDVTNIETHAGKVYILGSGKVEIHNTDSKLLPFKSAPVAGGGGGEVVYADNADKLDGHHASDFALKTEIPSALPANGGNADYATNALNADNADKLDGHHEDYFAKATNPSIEGNIHLLRSGSATTNGSIFAWEETVRIRNEDPNAENKTYIDFVVTPSGVFAEGFNNGNYIGRQQIYTGRPYVVGSGTIPAYGISCTTNHGFVPSAVFWWYLDDTYYIRSASSFDSVSFTVNVNTNVEKSVGYIIFK